MLVRTARLESHRCSKIGGDALTKSEFGLTSLSNDVSDSFIRDSRWPAGKALSKMVLFAEKLHWSRLVTEDSRRAKTKGSN